MRVFFKTHAGSPCGVVATKGAGGPKGTFPQAKRKGERALVKGFSTPETTAASVSA